MKSNVKARDRDVERLRTTALRALGLGTLSLACRTTSDTDGLVLAPMLDTAAAGTSTGVSDAGPDAVVATRPLHEPYAPAGQECNRKVECIAALPRAPTFPFRAPYERCDPSPIGELGRLSARETDDHRRAEPDVCCYVSFEGCSRRGRPIHVQVGRPLRNEDGEWIIARSRRDEGWLDAAVGERDDHDWLDAALGEHASVAEFARVTRALLAHAGPPDLIAAAQRAALDEIAHARTCFSASGRGGAGVGPASLPVHHGARQGGILSVLRNTLRDGCYGEAAGALVLRSRARATGDPAFAERLHAMADDEERHAELAWRIVRWASRVAAADTIAELRHFLGWLGRDEVADGITRPCASALLIELERTRRGGSCAREA